MAISPDRKANEQSCEYNQPKKGLFHNQLNLLLRRTTSISSRVDDLHLQANCSFFPTPSLVIDTEKPSVIVALEDSSSTKRRERE
jgi:hypothetical protein